MRFCVLLSLAAAVAHGCGPSDKAEDSGDSPAGTDPGGPDADTPPPEDVESRALFEVVGGPFDLTSAPDGRVFASVAEHAIDVWDPETAWVETHTDNPGAVFGIVWADGDLYYSTSNHRQSGALMRLDGRTGSMIADAAGSTVFREPRDSAEHPTAPGSSPTPRWAPSSWSETTVSAWNNWVFHSRSPARRCRRDPRLRRRRAMVRIPWPEAHLKPSTQDPSTDCTWWAIRCGPPTATGGIRRRN